ncbi:hypothetical protein F4774DRAFT_409887 [Daldinia eschscholtzii]|nr:hypothetical protein F4774DRAFT_409887 [Daldinia eschscholtzii]
MCTEESGTPSDEFYANAFVLHFQGLQQTDTDGIFQDIPRPETTHPGPQLVEDLIQDVERNVDKKRLGQNLLDSFALILARPGGKGVVAVAVEKNKNQNIYTLHVSINSASNNALSPLAEEIQKWFNDRKQDTVESGDLWNDILRNCCENISTSIANACIGCTQEAKAKKLMDTLIYIESLDIPLDKAGIEVKKRVAKILTLLASFFSTSSSVYSEILALEKSEDAAIYALRRIDLISTGPVLCFLSDITKECFELLETHAWAMEKYFRDLYTKLRGKRNKGETPGHKKRLNYRKLLRRVRSLIYTISKYLRAWYDIVHFKAHCNSATLLFDFGPGQVHRSGGRRLDFDKILSQAAQLGIFDEANKESMKAFHDVRQNCISAWNHCEMQMLEFVLAKEESRFYNYIGCSKGPCWLCYHVLVNMTSQFEMRPSHFKLYPRWLPPNFTKDQAHKEQFVAVLKLLTKEMRRLIDLRKGGEYQPRNAKPDCPDDEDTFLSLREAPKS